MEKDPTLFRFIAAKRKFEDDGWKIFWIFESFFLKELKEIYGKKLVSLEERLDEENIDPKKFGNFLMCGHVRKNFDENIAGVKIVHVGSCEGFGPGEIVMIQDENSSDPNKDKSERFIQAFKKLVGNRDLIPDKSVLLINKEKHHQRKSRVRAPKENSSISMKKREKSSQIPGQKTITDFFAKTKEATSGSSPYKKPIPIPLQPLEIDEITQKLRGDTVKILWMPKRHSELNASQIISVFLLNEVARTVEMDENDKKTVDLKANCATVVNEFPNHVWKIVVDLINKFEDYYLNKADDSEAEEMQCKIKIKEEKNEKAEAFDEENDQFEVVINEQDKDETV